MRAPEPSYSNLDGPFGKTETYRLLVWLIILLALGLRLARLAFQPLWWDEGWSLYFSTTGVRTILELTAVDIHPPFYYLLLLLWAKLFGVGVISVRLLSVFVGTLTVPLLYITGRRLWGAAGGLLAALLLALSPFHIYYSQEVRMYGLVTLLGLIAFYLALREEWVNGGRGWIVWGGYVLAAAAALYTQYYAAFLLLALNISALFRWIRHRRPFLAMVPWLAAQAAVAFLFLPWLWYAGGRLLAYVRYKVSVEQDPALVFIDYIGHHLAAFDWGHAEGILADWWCLGLLPLAILLVSLSSLLWKQSRRVRFRAWLLGPGQWPLTIVVVVLACGFAVNSVFPFNPPRVERLLLLALPAYVLLVSAGLLVLWHHCKLLATLSFAAFLGAAVLSLAFFYTTPRYPEDDYRPVAARLRALASPTDVIVAVHPWQVGYFQAYIPDNQRPYVVLTPREVLPQEQQLWADDPDRMSADLDALLAEHGRLWLPAHQAMGRVLESQIESYLARHAYPVLSEWQGENTVLSLFSAGEPAPQPITARFGEWLVLEGIASSPGPLEAGRENAAIDLTWRLLETPGERYHVGLRLVDRLGNVWAQRDSEPVGGLRHFFDWPVDESHVDHHGLWIPAGTPPGNYSLTLRVYRSHDMAVLPVVFEGGSGGEFEMGMVRIVRPESPPPKEALSFDQSLQVDFGHWLRLLGFSMANQAVFLPGEALEVDLFWQALSDPGEDFLPQFQLLDPTGASMAELIEKPVAGTYPTAWWREGELVRDPHAMPIPATVPAGRYRLVLSLLRAADGTLVGTTDGETSVDLTGVTVQDREHVYWPTQPEHSQLAPVGSSVELIGYDLREVVRAPGSPLEVTLHWHALATPDRAYHTFVHLLDAEGEIVTQHDGAPGEGELPALGWLPGEFLTDTHLLQLPFDLPDGVYRLEVGLYDPATSERLGQPVLLNRPVPVEASGGCNCR